MLAIFYSQYPEVDLWIFRWTFLLLLLFLHCLHTTNIWVQRQSLLTVGVGGRGVVVGWEGTLGLGFGGTLGLGLGGGGLIFWTNIL